MAVTTTGDLNSGIAAKIQDDFIVWATKEEIWGQFVNWKGVPIDGGGASSYSQTVVNRLNDAVTALSETSDVQPQTLSDGSFSITPDLYGNAVALSLKTRYQNHPDALAEAAEVVGCNRAASVDRLIRNGVLNATMILRPNNNVLRTGLDATNDKPTFAFLTNLVSYARSQGFRPYEGDHYVSVIHPLVADELRTINQWQNPGSYRVDNDNLYTGEIGKLANIRFIEHLRGKLYLSGGTTGQSATTLNGAVAAGATSIIVTDATGLSAGDFITLGTLEASDAEQVQITAVSGTTLTVRGVGNDTGNFGTRYAHADGAAVTEAANVGAIPILGKRALHGRYGEEEGRYGKVIEKPNQGVLNQFTYLGWRWYGGLGIYQKEVVIGECAVSGGHFGDN